MVVLEARCCQLLGDRDKARRLPQQRHPLQAQAQVEEILKDNRQLTGAGLQDPGADAVRAGQPCAGEDSPVRWLCGIVVFDLEHTVER